LSEVALYTDCNWQVCTRQANQQTSALWPKLNMSAKSDSGAKWTFADNVARYGGAQCVDRRQSYRLV